MVKCAALCATLATPLVCNAEVQNGSKPQNGFPTNARKKNRMVIKPQSHEEE